MHFGWPNYMPLPDHVDETCNILLFKFYYCAKVYKEIIMHKCTKVRIDKSLFKTCNTIISTQVIHNKIKRIFNFQKHKCKSFITTFIIVTK